MRHCSPEELLDIAEGSGPQASPSHLTTCEACRKQLAELRAVMATLADVEVPEPSPLFWDHLSSRVREAVDGAVPARKAWWSGGNGWASIPRLGLPLSAAVAAVAIIVAVALRSAPPVTVEGPIPDQASIETADARTGDTDLLADDPTFNLVSDLTADIDLETALAAGLVSDDSAEHALIHMDSGELMELEELLKAELPGGPGGQVS